MATQKQKKLAKMIVENAKRDKPLNGGEMLEKVGYSEHLVKQPGRVLEAEGVQEELGALGFTEENAMMVVKEIMMNNKVDSSSRLKATDQVFKVKGSYAPEKIKHSGEIGSLSDEDREMLDNLLNAQRTGS